MNGGSTMAWGYRQYRCELCRTTSPSVLGEEAFRRERRNHRNEFHGGHTPDGERVIEAPRFNYFDLPRVQQIFAPIVLIVFAVALYIRLG